ncbi:amidohydrolase [Pandoraea nosoerga]|uniref:Amidohydrolase n=1 Tax=Pandoraea nosoerga TaxID=2508296 RepID=A0A5E4RMC3_9BURK|nr:MULTISPECIES: M20 aminoacylase family protein [Pandoraea]MBN4664495.1 amidohydrolase [Pandoraea nosoerga]MBN4674469.1 amidohydrolase [Pandoraea nosoerga]MBN4679737.1 amidohydrolase [Pandoraea nosoerga]MBN4743175.1 amidohydrolase [Pandoraea nosoerga]VVD63582.1 amidohydrolase [Pandoraea nosoerga]
MTQDIYFAKALRAWRHAFHRQPETGFEEVGTSQTVAKILESLGLDVHRGIGGTGVVASLRAGDGKGVIGIRADMDALPIAENAPGREHASQVSGKMHACGHDGHMSMVLGAAKLLAESRDFNGTVRFIFQPAEEHGRGARAMIADGLLERFPIDAIYGVHNMPGIPSGHIATRAGGIMASEDNFVIRIRGKGTHAARPHMGVDPLVIGAQIVVALQTVVSRSVDPGMSAVVSCTEFITDGIRNAIPTNVVIKGDTRSYTPQVQRLLESRMREICTGMCAMHGAHCEFEYTHEFAPTVNHAENTALAVRAASAVVGAAMVDADVAPVMASEDFGVFLQHVPGNFAFIGNGCGDEPGATPLHNAGYDFNDAILPVGARYFAQIVRESLPR